MTQFNIFHSNSLTELTVPNLYLSILLLVRLSEETLMKTGLFFKIFSISHWTENSNWQTSMADSNGPERNCWAWSGSNTYPYATCASKFHNKNRFFDVFPMEKLIPKHHFLEHYPDLIKAFGPLVAMWTMRFEGKHSCFKHVVRHTNSFKNILLSLTRKHQLLMAYQAQNPSKPAFSVSDVSCAFGCIEHWCTESNSQQIPLPDIGAVGQNCILSWNKILCWYDSCSWLYCRAHWLCSVTPSCYSWEYCWLLG